MKHFQIKILSIVLSLGVVVSACEITEVDKVTDPNAPSSEQVLNNASESQLQNLVVGLESAHRSYIGWRTMVGQFGREGYEMDLNNPQNAERHLQHPSSAFNIEDFNEYGGSGYGESYFAVRQANLLVQAVENSDLVTDTEKEGYVGLAKTIKGYQLLMPLMRQGRAGEKGIRIALPYTNPLNPGPFLSYEDALSEIRSILDEGAAALNNAGDTFNLTLSAGFGNYNTPAGMLKVNRAIAARAAIYAEDWPGALDALGDSFLNLTDTPDALWAGPAHTYSGGLDETNPYFFNHDSPIVGLIAVNPEVIDDAEAGDERVENKFYRRDESFQYEALPAEGLPPVYFFHQIDLYPTLNSPIEFIRNEELILIYAEANAQLDNLQEALNAINLIRNTWGLNDFSSSNKNEIIDQILFERRYSLWMEGHRWIDMRRYGRLDEISTDLDGGRVPQYVATPVGEIDWEEYEEGL